MSIFEIEQNIQDLLKKSKTIGENFIYDLLLAYAIPKSSITRLKKGTYNQSKVVDEILWKNKLYFKYTTEDLHLTIEKLLEANNTKTFVPRFVIITNYDQLVAVDTRTKESLDIPISDFKKHFAFFLPWAGMEKTQLQVESLADIRAASKMAKLYDEIVTNNPYPKSGKDQISYAHNLNIFFSRLLFCFFADDTGIFPTSGQFITAISSHTQSDGSDVHAYIDEIFAALNSNDSSQKAKHISDFPYVNGGLFASKKLTPNFSRKARRLMLECGELDWSQINPDIFGSMIQAVVRPDERDALGMHYTSVENIMKVINPLFLEDLWSEINKSSDNEKKLEELLGRIYTIKIFDPACGSGNFLVIAYKELRKLEHSILERLSDLSSAFQLRMESGVRLENFHGIEIDDFAAEIAQLSLWLAKHQMNLEFEEKFGVTTSIIPLVDSGHIVCENAARIDWEIVCPKNKDYEVYLIGNPPYLGSKLQDEYQKEDFKLALSNKIIPKTLDYIVIWFLKGAEYICNSKAQLAFVSTNSVVQGEQVSLIWPDIFDLEIEIGFAHTSFKWGNLAKGNAGVTCVIIGLRNKNSSKKYIINHGISNSVENINPYLVDSSNNIAISRRTVPISNLPVMEFGNMPLDGGNLLFTDQEKKKYENEIPELKKFLKPILGSREFINDIKRWCLWIEDSDLERSITISLIKERINSTKRFRLNSSDGGTRKHANRSHQLREMKKPKKLTFIVPRVSSERREYIPIGYLGSDTVISDSAHAVYDAEPYIFGLLTSKMHMTWVRAVAGRLKTDFRYSSTIVYNNFPVPDLSDKQKQMIENHVHEVISARENHSEKTIAQRYDPDKMPDDLRTAHHQLDQVVELCYRSKPFESDEKRLSHLFKLYETMIEKEKES